MLMHVCPACYCMYVQHVNACMSSMLMHVCPACYCMYVQHVIACMSSMLLHVCPACGALIYGIAHVDVPPS